MERSLIILKALTSPPLRHRRRPHHLPARSPQRPRNWDYRYSWLRDATFTLSAPVHAGERRLPELELSWLPGYEDSRPVTSPPHPPDSRADGRSDSATLGRAPSPFTTAQGCNDHRNSVQELRRVVREAVRERFGHRTFMVRLEG